MNTLREEKLFYERFWSLMGDPALVRIYERFGTPAFRRSSVLEGFENFVKANGFTGDTVVEIGTLKGLTAIVLARYFRRVVTIDIIDDPQKIEFVTVLSIGNVEFINVRDNAAKYEAIAGLRFDAAYCDGDHTHDTVQDFEAVRRCGRVLFHEAWDAQPAVLDLLGGLPGTVARKDKWALWTA